MLAIFVVIGIYSIIFILVNYMNIFFILALSFACIYSGLYVVWIILQYISQSLVSRIKNLFKNDTVQFTLVIIALMIPITFLLPGIFGVLD